MKWTDVEIKIVYKRAPKKDFDVAISRNGQLSVAIVLTCESMFNSFRDIKILAVHNLILINIM